MMPIDLPVLIEGVVTGTMPNGSPTTRMTATTR